MQAHLGRQHLVKKKRTNSNKIGDPFKFVSEALDFASDLVAQSKGDYAAVCFSICYAAARVAFLEKQNDLKPAIHLLLTAYVRACEDIINEEANIEKHKGDGVILSGKTFH